MILTDLVLVVIMWEGDTASCAFSVLGSFVS